MEVKIREVKSKEELKQFVKFPFALYNGHPHWVPPIIRAEMATLNPTINPVFEHSEAILFTAWKGSQMVGRIAGMINQMEVDFINEKHARFGWVDFIEDKEVSKALFNAVEKWAKNKGMSLLKGPFGFNQLDKNGMLTEGFDSTGTVNTIYNFPYYPQFLEGLGYKPDLEWVEVFMNVPKMVPDRLKKFNDIAKKRYKLKSIQPKSKAEMIEVGEKMFELLMDTYKDLPGFVPIAKNQIKDYINRYIKFLRKDFVAIVVNENEEPVAFGVTIPSMTKAYQKSRGRLYPFGILRMLVARKWNKTVDLALIGVREEWRKRGAHALVFNDNCLAIIKAKIKTVQINPMLANNTHVLSLWKDFDHQIYKKRKTFKKTL